MSTSPSPLWLAFFLGLALCTAPSLLAIPGDLDPSFGNGGTGLYAPTIGTSAVVQTDGKLVVAGHVPHEDGGSSDFAVLRCLDDGSLDPTFGGTGMVTIDFGAEDQALAIALDGDKIVVAGFTGAADMAVARLNADGTLDATFNGTGKLVTDFGGYAAGYDYVRGVAVQPDHKIVLTGETIVAFRAAFAVARYLENGTPDPEFGTNGKVTTDFGSETSGSYARAVAVQPDGNIVVAGYVNGPGSISNLALARYSANGTLDPGFNTTGKVTTTIGGGHTRRANSVALQADGKIVVAGSGGGKMLVARFNAAGALDLDFDGRGYNLTAMSGDAYGVALESDGKIVIAGSAAGFGVARFKPDGTPETNFQSTGELTTSFAGGGYANAVVVQKDGKMVAAGSGSGVLALARYEVAFVPLFTIDDVNVNEPGAATTNAVLTVSLTPPAAVDTTVDYATAPPFTAEEGQDYTAVSGTLHFSAGTATQSIVVPVRADAALEGIEQGQVVLSNPSAGTRVQKATGTFSILPYGAKRPDARIRLMPSGRFVGDNVYANTAAAQTVSTSVKGGRAASFQVVIQNDGKVYDSFTISAPYRAIFYGSGGVSITEDVITGQYTTPVLAPGKSAAFAMRLQTDITMRFGSTLTEPVTVASVANPARVDVVRARVTLLTPPFVGQLAGLRSGSTLHFLIQGESKQFFLEFPSGAISAHGSVFGFTGNEYKFSIKRVNGKVQLTISSRRLSPSTQSLLL